MRSYSKMSKFDIFGHRSYTSRDPTDLSPRHFTPPMGTTKPPENRSVGHREVYACGRGPYRGPFRGHLGSPGGGAGMNVSDVVRHGAALRRLSMIALGCLNTFYPY